MCLKLYKGLIRPSVEMIVTKQDKFRKTPTYVASCHDEDNDYKNLTGQNIFYNRYVIS